MSKSGDGLEKLEKQIRKSLPNDSKKAPAISAQRRNTVTSEYNPKVKKTVKIPTITEDESDDGFAIENEQKREIKLVKKPSVVSTASKSTFVYENSAFEGNLKRSGSTANSERSTRTPSRAPSVQSLVVREQYCCCSRRTKCEKILLVVVTVLGFIIVVLVIALIAVARNESDPNSTVSQVFGL